MAIIITISGRWAVLASAFADRRLVRRLLVAAAAADGQLDQLRLGGLSNHVLEAALGYFMAPLATMVLGVTVLHERADAAASVRHGARRPSRSSC